MTPHLRQLLDEYGAAVCAWEKERERETNGYETERRAWEREHPRPTWKAFLTGGRKR